MKKVGIIGWRGMVGSVLMDRMKEENDFKHCQTYFFSTSQKGEKNPYANLENTHDMVLDSEKIEELIEMDIIISCQGGDYTKKIHPELRSKGFKGYWIDAASTLRTSDNATIILDPINKKLIEKNLDQGQLDFAGGNCTVSLLLLALGGLVEANVIEYISSMTYQAASGAGAQNMIELLGQMNYIGNEASKLSSKSILELEKEITLKALSSENPTKNFGHSLALNLLPFIDVQMENGQSKEEWKACYEANKILNRNGNDKILIDGTCVRVGALRCHSQALTVKLKKNIPLNEIEKMLTSHNEWVKFIPNDRETTLKDLNPLKVSGKMDILVGRVRKMNLGEEFLNVFTIGDQLLWGAAEPLRRMLRILLAK